MTKKIIGIMLMILITLNVGVCTFGANDLKNKPEVLDLTYTLKNKQGNPDIEITSGGTLEVSITLENNTSGTQPYTVMLQILNNGNKVSLKSRSGSLNSAQQEIICLSDGFPKTETDFSKYSAEVYLWSDMTSMQPISTYSVFGSDNNSIYAYKIDDDLVYTNNSTFLSYYFGKNYSGTPRIMPIFHDPAAKYTVTPSSTEVTTRKQNINFNVTSQLGSVKDYCLEVYKITDETDPKNADVKNATLSMGAYNANHNMISTLYPAFNKDITEYTIFTYKKDYISLPISFETVNPDATVSLTTAPDTTAARTKAVYTVTSADGSAAKDYTFNYIVANDGTKRTSFAKVANIYTKESGTCLAGWNGKASQFASGSDIYLQDGIFVRSASDKRPIRPTSAIIEIDISNVPDTLAFGVLRLAHTATFNAAKDGLVTLHKIDSSIYDLADLSAITSSDVATYLKDELYTFTVSKKAGNNADMHLVNIGDDYVKELKASGRTKMYVGITGKTTDSENGFSAQFDGVSSDLSKYTTSLFEYVAAE